MQTKVILKFMEIHIPTKSSLQIFHEKTRQALLWMNLSNEPFVVLYALLAFILRKDLAASLYKYRKDLQ